jgi:hypothetical protein
VYVSEENTASIFGAALKMEAVFSSETLVSIFKVTLHYKPEDQHQHPHRRENVKSRNAVKPTF